VLRSLRNTLAAIKGLPGGAPRIEPGVNARLLGQLEDIAPRIKFAEARAQSPNGVALSYAQKEVI
jgi:hypothetical protein